MCKTPLGIILKPMMAIFGLSNQVDLIQEAFESGEPLEISIRFVQLICMLFGISSQCFTGETLVSTENGFVQISEINVGDYVWTENVETGEKELKQVLHVYVNETDTLVHVSITDENGSKTTINTTENHPFYTEGKGWVTASQLETGNKLHTKDGVIQVVKEVSVEKLNEPVKIYNLEVDNQHTYYVSDSEVLVHNKCTNPNGKKGGEKHQGKIGDIENEITSRKNNYDEEVSFEYTDSTGKKRYRFADVVELVNGEITKIYQVGRTNNNGTPVIRERRAIQDIFSSPKFGKLTNVKIEFISYDGRKNTIYTLDNLEDLNL